MQPGEACLVPPWRAIVAHCRRKGKIGESRFVRVPVYDRIPANGTNSLPKEQLYTMQMPQKDQHLIGQRQTEQRMAMMLGRRTVKLLVLAGPLTRAVDDLVRATEKS